MSGYTSAGDFLVSQVAGRRCTFLARNSSISLAGSEDKRINFSQQSPKMLKMASESFIHVLLLFLDVFLKISRWVPLNSQTRVSSSETINLVIPLETNTFQDCASKIFNSLPPPIKSCTNFCFFFSKQTFNIIKERRKG